MDNLKNFASCFRFFSIAKNMRENGKHEPTTKIKRKIVELCKENNIDLEGDK